MPRSTPPLVLFALFVLAADAHATLSPVFTPEARPDALAREAIAALRPPAPGTSVAMARAHFAARAESLGLVVVDALGEGSPAGPATAALEDRRRANPFDLVPERVVLLRAREAGALRRGVARLAAGGGVEWVEPNRAREIAAFPEDLSLPDDPLFRDTRQWALWNAGAAGVYRGTAGADIGARAAWAIGCGADDVRLAIGDTGVDPRHPDLDCAFADGTRRLVSGQNVATGPSFAWADSNGHGTAVAGVMAALTDDGAHFDSLGVAGVCGGDGHGNHGCRIVPIKMTSGGTGFMSSFDVANAIVWAARAGARAINLSVTGGGDSRAERAALYFAITRGCVAVAASGNSGAGANPAIGYPAGYAGEGLAIAVGASDAEDRRAAFSSYGPALDLVAPGLDVWTTAPTYPNANGARWPGYLVASGTSFAAPHVTGTIGLMAARHRGLADTDFQQLLRATARDLGPAGRDDETGWGRLDAAAAVRAADPALAVWHDERPAEVRSDGVFAPLVVVADSFGNLGAAGSLAGLVAERFSAIVTLAIPDSFADDARVWPRVGGTMALRGDFVLGHWAPWAEVVERRGREVTLRGHLYRVPLESPGDAPPDADELWLPLPPDQARIGFTVFGRTRAPALAVDAPRPPAAPRVEPNPSRGPVRVLGPAGARVAIHDLAGRHLRTLTLGKDGAAAWDGADASGRRVPAGLCFARFTAGRAAATRIVRLE